MKKSKKNSKNEDNLPKKNKRQRNKGDSRI